MTKYIHYCWFGTKPLPKLAEKCLKSWKKYLPDYEIIKWSEENVDLDECPFIREAYDNKKWAFVADYARTKALNEMGGIYFDTDMEVTKNIDDLLQNKTFLGVEDTGCVNSAVWYEQEKNSYLTKKLLEKYRKFDHFNPELVSSFSIPILITEILDELGFQRNSFDIQKLNHDIYIYPRDYFYPYSFGRDNNKFTDNTRMIHYNDASWIPLKERIETGMVRKIGRKNTYKVLNFYRHTKHIVRQTAKIVLFPLVMYRNHKRRMVRVNDYYFQNVKNAINSIKKYENKEYIVIHNGEWFGVTSATKELFENTVDCRELYRNKDVKRVGDTIINCHIKQVIFSAMSIGDYKLCKYLKKKHNDIKIKSFWHGSHSQIHDGYGWVRNKEIIKLHRKGIIDVMGTCKRSLYNFYVKEGFNVCFITNKVTTDVKPVKTKTKRDGLIIGLYAAKCDDWRKNMFTQMAAVSLIPKATIDITPLNESAIEFAKQIGLNITGVNNNLSREDLLKRMSNNDLNLYVTYSECAPMLPLESFEMGVPCITGNNHHYFADGPLDNYLLVKNEEDPVQIKNKILECIDNKKEVLKLYNDFRKNNLEESKQEVEKFLRM